MKINKSESKFCEGIRVPQTFPVSHSHSHFAPVTSFHFISYPSGLLWFGIKCLRQWMNEMDNMIFYIFLQSSQTKKRSKKNWWKLLSTTYSFPLFSCMLLCFSQVGLDSCLFIFYFSLMWDHKGGRSGKGNPAGAGASSHFLHGKWKWAKENEWKLILTIMSC